MVKNITSQLQISENLKCVFGGWNHYLEVEMKRIFSNTPLNPVLEKIQYVSIVFEYFCIN